MQAYYGVTVTLADTNAHRLMDLLIAIDPTLAEVLQNVGTLGLQGGSANGVNKIYVGDSNVASTRLAWECPASGARTYTKEAMSIPLGAIWVRASAATVTLNVEIIP